MHPTRPRRPNRVRKVPERYGLPPVAAPVVVPELPPRPLNVFVRKHLLVINVETAGDGRFAEFNLNQVEYFGSDPTSQFEHDLDRFERDTGAFARMGCAAGKYYWRSYTMDYVTSKIDWRMKGSHERFVQYDTKTPEEIVCLTRGTFDDVREDWVFRTLEEAVHYVIPPWTRVPGREDDMRTSEPGVMRGMLVGPYYISAHRYPDLTRANNLVFKAVGQVDGERQESRGAPSRCSIM